MWLVRINTDKKPEQMKCNMCIQKHQHHIIIISIILNDEQY